MLIIKKQDEKNEREVAGESGGANSSAIETVENRDGGFEFDKLPIYFLPDVETEGNAGFTERLESIKTYLSEGDQIVSHSFGVMTEEHELFHSGCPAIKVRSDVNEYVMIFDEYLYEGGEFRDCDIPYGNYHPVSEREQRRLRNPVIMFLVTEFGKALMKQAAKELYDKFFQRDNDANMKAELAKLKAEFSAIAEEIYSKAKYESLEDTLISTRAWVRDTLSLRLAGIPEGKYTALGRLRDELYQMQDGMKRTVDLVDARLSDQQLENCDYLTRLKVMLYASCACLRILLFKEMIYIQKLLLERGDTKEDSTSTDIAELQAFVQTAADNLEQYVKKLRDGRYEKITGVSKYQDERDKYIPLIGYVHQVEIGFQWEDDFESKNNNDPFRGDRIHSKIHIAKEEGRGVAQTERDKHYEAVKSLLIQYVSDPLGEVIKNIRETKIEIRR
jgi:hypothetical protein